LKKRLSDLWEKGERDKAAKGKRKTFLAHFPLPPSPFPRPEIGYLATEIIREIYEDLVQRREQFLNLIFGCLMRIYYW
jgi:hypothetical protein